MSRLRVFLIVAAILCSAAPAAAAPECNRLEHAGNAYSVCIVDLTASDLRLFWQDAGGTPLRTIRSVADQLPAGERLAFAMNAGMFDGDYAPVGLFIQDGVELVALNTNEGPGNFHLLPNGVFYWNGDTAGVMETNRFVAERPDAMFATQSGPMLLIDGEVHPRFLPDSDSRKLRNGVGIVDEHTVAFVLTNNAVTFYEFALMFRDALGVRNALYLDGSVSAMFAPALNRQGAGWFGPILGVVER
ncbi:MAG: phosphodiester glycosidase family protein [Bauldia sp.]